MGKSFNPWKPEDTEIARKLLARDAPEYEFIDTIKRTKAASKQHIMYVDNPKIRERMAERGRRRREAANVNSIRLKVSTAFREIPDFVIEDAARRLSAPRSLTAMLLGDPAPGQSALDKRMGVAA